MTKYVERKGNRIKRFLKEYNSPLVLAGGWIVGGAIGTAGFAVGVAQQLYDATNYLLSTGDIVGTAISLYNSGALLAGQVLIPTCILAKFGTYKCKKFVEKVFSYILGKRR